MKKRLALLFAGLTICVLAAFSSTLYIRHQKKDERKVETARNNKSELIKSLFIEADVEYPPFHVVLRNFKMERSPGKLLLSSGSVSG
jgi:hypothetical protein